MGTFESLEDVDEHSDADSYVLNNGKVGKRYAASATPAQFQLASTWYYSRLRALVVVSVVQSLLNGIIVSALYLGISCKYRSFVQLSEKPTHPGLAERTTYFA